MQDYENTTPEEREIDAIAYADKWLAVESPEEKAMANILGPINRQIAETCREIENLL